MLTARQEFETTICRAMSEIEASRRLQIFLANRVLALGWALKGACKPCAHRLFATARWLVPEAQRFLLQRISAKNRNQLLFEWLLSRIRPRIVAGLLIVLAFWGALNFALRTTATETAPLVDSSAYPQEFASLAGRQHRQHQQIFANAGFCFRNWFHLSGANCTGSASCQKTCKDLQSRSRPRRPTTFWSGEPHRPRTSKG